MKLLTPCGFEPAPAGISLPVFPSEGDWLNFDLEPYAETCGSCSIGSNMQNKSSMTNAKQKEYDSTPAGFEPAPSEMRRFLIYRLNHSATVPVDEVAEWKIHSDRVRNCEENAHFLPLPLPHTL